MLANMLTIHLMLRSRQLKFLSQGAINQFRSNQEKMEVALNNLILVTDNGQGFKSSMIDVQNLLND